MFFDWISIVFLILLIVGFCVGMSKGFLSSISGFTVFVIALVAAFFLATPVADALMESDFGTGTYDGLLEVISEKLGQFSTQEVGREFLESEEGAVVLAGLYDEMNIPEFLRVHVTNLLISVIPEAELVEFAPGIAQGLTRGICVILGFGAILIGIMLVFGILKLIVWIIRHGARKKPSMLSRVLGGITNVAQTLIWLYAIAFVIGMLTTQQNEVADYLIETLKLNEEGWSLAKWMVQDNFLFSWMSSFLAA